MKFATAADLVRLQHPTGCFPSEVGKPDGAWTDHNGFTTAMVLRELRSVSNDPVLDRVRTRALNFVERCRSTKVPDAFAFWPDDLRPAWALKVPADIDDTAIMTTELLRSGRLNPSDALRTVCHALVPHRIRDDDTQPRPPWIWPGAFPTWIGRRDVPNVVDCCVNANALALMALVDATPLPGYAEAVKSILSGLDWAQHDSARLRSLTPFYPSKHDLTDAVEHAVECGVTELRAALYQLQNAALGRDATECCGCCSSAYGAMEWRCRGIEVARALRRCASMEPDNAWNKDRRIPELLGQTG